MESLRHSFHTFLQGLLAIALIAAATPLLAQTKPFIFTGNPIVKYKYTADCAVMVDGDTLWMYAGHDQGGPGTRGYRMWEWNLFSTTDMVHWEEHPSPCRIDNFFPWARRGKAYAAHCIKSREDGRYYFYVSTNGPGIGVAVADSPKGPFQDALGKPLLTNADCKGTTHGWACIDPMVFYDEKGQPWITWGNVKCYIARLKPNMTEIDGKIYDITPKKSHFTEAPWIEYHDGLYYLTFAQDFPEQLGYAVSKRPQGPYKYKGVFSGVAYHSDTTHPAFATFRGQHIFFTHNGFLPGGSGNSRSICAMPFEYGADGSLPRLDPRADTIYWKAEPLNTQHSTVNTQHTSYLFAYFEGQGPTRQQEQLRLAISDDGEHWRALNDNKPIVPSDSISLSGGIRDPHILRGEGNDGYFMVMTDMYTIKNGWDRNTGIVLMHSRDLKHWRHATIDLVRDYPNTFGNVKWVWAPQTIWDPEKKAYMVYFTVSQPGHGSDLTPDDPVLKLYAAHVNPEFTAFTEEPKLMLNLRHGAIDEDIVYNPDDRLYHMFFKGNDKNAQGKETINGIKQAVASSLNGPWREDYLYVDAYAGKTGVEGSGVFRLNAADEARTGYKWALMYDMYRTHRYEYQLSNDLFHFTEPRAFDKNFNPRHGTVMGITADEKKVLEEMDHITLIPNDSAYLFTFFSDPTHSLFMAVSYDGYHFRAINGGKPVIAGDTVAVQHGIRDPHIFRGPDGAYYLSMTDLHIFGKQKGYRNTEWERDGKTYGWGNNRDIILMKSRDLIHWSRHQVFLQKQFPKDFKDLCCFWAPETAYDPAAKKLMLYFTLRRTPQSLCEVYWAYVDNDYTRLTSKPKLLFTTPKAGMPTLDADICPMPDGRFFMTYASQERPANGIRYMISDRINGGYQQVLDGQIDAEQRACEAPNTWKRIGEDRWVVMYDCYGIRPHNFGFVETTDFKTFTPLGRFNEGVMKAENFQSPKHGSVIHITREEAERLEKHQF